MKHLYILYSKDRLVADGHYDIELSIMNPTQLIFMFAPKLFLNLPGLHLPREIGG